MRLTPLNAAGPKVRRDGLTILEVIVSLAILVIALAAVGLLINMGSDNELQTRMTTTGTRLAQSKLAEVEAGIVSFDTTSGDFGDGEPGWSWTMNAADQGKNLWLVNVTVTREYRGTQFQMSMGQMVLDPSIRGSAAKLSRPSSSTSTTGSSTSTTGSSTSTTGGNQ
ncbi:MAG TPA: prepilin-type N-terminal cleavage/methylation domain-containing protein [Gemmata sp.]|nr:prepilin-type N-terminal cleavage/methylation domain-containing protein [Gemmata sp.]